MNEGDYPRPAAREILVEVLPVPPFCEAIEIIIIVSTHTKAHYRGFLRSFSDKRIGIIVAKVKRAK
jgi:hypothetical protein